MCKVNTPYGYRAHLGLALAYNHIVAISQMCRMGSPSRFCLTNPHMGRNYNYITGCHSDGQTRTIRSEDAGAQAHRDAQSKARCRHRSSIHGESVLRSEGPSASPLRDAPPPRRREHVDSRRGDRLRRLAANFLSGPRGLQPVWASRLVAESAWTERWTQGHRRSSGPCGKSARGRPPADYRSVRASRPGALRNYGPSAQSGASFGQGQKKTTPSDLKSSLAHDAASSYERLRPQLIDSTDQSGAATGRSVLLRRGMLAWTRAYGHVPATPTPTSVGRGCMSPVPSVIVTELVQIMAGLILSNGKGCISCLN